MNLFLILGIAGTLRGLTVKMTTVWREIPFSLIAIILVFFLVNNERWFGGNNEALVGWEGILLLVFFGGFIYYVVFNLKREIIEEGNQTSVFPLPKTLVLTGLGLLGLSLGGKLVVDNAVTIARFFQVSEKFIGLTIVSIGTSLPELATSIVATYQRKADMAVGNVIGSNIFNLLFIFMFTSGVRKLDRWEAVLYLLAFAGYLWYLWIRK